MDIPDLAWYWWLLIAFGAILIFVLVRVWLSDSDWDDDRGLPDPDSEPNLPHVVYYLDEPQLRQLAHSCDVPLPPSREITASESKRLGSKRIGIERGKSETFSSPPQLNLDQIGRKLRYALRYTPNALADDLEWEPHVPSKEMIETVAARIRVRYGDAKTDLLAELLRVLEEEIRETVVTEKRAAFERIADANRSLYLTGYFARTDDDRGYRVVRLSRLFAQSYEDTPVPAGIDLRIVLANPEAFTGSGVERLDRPQPFFGRIIAHSPTYDASTGVLTASAVAAWGLSRDAVQLENPAHRYSYGC